MTILLIMLFGLLLWLFALLFFGISWFIPTRIAIFREAFNDNRQYLALISICLVLAGIFLGLLLIIGVTIYQFQFPTHSSDDNLYSLEAISIIGHLLVMSAQWLVILSLVAVIGSILRGERQKGVAISVALILQGGFYIIPPVLLFVGLLCVVLECLD